MTDPHLPALEFPVRWAEYPDPTVTAEWRELVAWLRWLVERYELGQTIPACWHQHGVWIEDLTALCDAWHAAYDEETTTQTGALQWHEALDQAIRRWNTTWRELTGGCTTSRHIGDRHPAQLYNAEYWAGLIRSPTV